jgi:adenine-specific DNA-methyltransferase
MEVSSIKHNLGQYFTKSKLLKEKLYEFILNKPNVILEPSVGRGDLVEFISQKRQMVRFDCFEIDEKIDFIIPREAIVFGDFLKQDVKDKYVTIVANPPYVRTKKGNLYIDFIVKCFDLLDEKGEMIFIVPSDFFQLTSASKIIQKMVSLGSFTHIFHPNQENLFEQASIDVLIFRYQKSSPSEVHAETIIGSRHQTVLFNDQEKYIYHHNGLVTFSDGNTFTKRVNELFFVYVGIVSGKDDVYKQSYGNISVLIEKDKRNNYIYIENFPSSSEKINYHLLQHKDKLLNRKIKKFNENNWFQWGAPRNISIMKKNIGQDCIYVHNLTRKSEIAFLGQVEYFGGNLLMLKPKEPIEKTELIKIVKNLNDSAFKEPFIKSGRFKIGHKQISESLCC